MHGLLSILLICNKKCKWLIYRLYIVLNGLNNKSSITRPSTHKRQGIDLGQQIHYKENVI